MSLMALKLFPIPIPFPVSSPNPNLNPNPNPFEVRFARWNNANAEKFNERRRSQQEIEDDLRRLRRFNSITKITHNYNPATPTKISETHPFKSVGTPSSPSRSSIPGRKSKYSKPESHPAFRPRSRITKLPPPPSSQEPPVDRNATINLSDDGLSYIVDGAPFEFKYSYTETPKVKPLKLREAPFSPFGPTTMPRPWTGRAPSQPTKKKLKEFDSFQLPPPHKKGVKPVQSPGPFRPGSGPRYVYSREEILGEPLTEEEIQEMVNSSLRSDRQLNMGRDGLTHNMLDNIHAHWKRRRVCKIKCKGVCTVDMDNVYQQLEEKTGGKIIYKKGGVLYLFRGRNYNYRTRPRFPLMLWKPITPLYPRLVERVPKGLTLEEASEMRTKGRMLIPICKLGKNGVYSDLPRQVREAFEECELVRINCQGVKGSDYRKIGAKLRDVVPCVLISFEREHILMWRGRDWKSMFTKLNDCEEAKGSSVDIAASTVPQVANQEIVMPPVEAVKHDLVSTCTTPPIAYQDNEIPSVEDVSHSTVSTSIAPSIIAHQDDDMPSVEDVNTPDVDTSIPRSEGKGEDLSTVERAETCESMGANSITANIYQSRSELDNTDCSSGTASEVMNNIKNGSEAKSNDTGYSNDEMLTATLVGSDPVLGSVVSKEMLEDVSEMSRDFNEPAKLSVACTEGVLLLLKQAVENGSAIVLDDAALDADIIYQRAVSFAKSAPPDPVYKRRHKPEVVQEDEKKQESEDLAVVEDVAQVNKVAAVSKNSRSNLKTYKVRGAKELNELYVDPPPKGTLGIDELAKLLA